MHEYKSIWNAVTRQVQHVALIQHYITASAEEQTVLQGFHVFVNHFKEPQQLLTNHIQSKLTLLAGWQTQNLRFCYLMMLMMHPDQGQFGAPP